MDGVSVALVVLIIMIGMLAFFYMICIKSQSDQAAIYEVFFRFITTVSVEPTPPPAPAETPRDELD